MRSKILTFRKVLSELNPSVFLVEETKCNNEGQFKLGNDYIVYELLRKDRAGGGLALGCLKDLQPAWVREGNDQVEALSVDIFVKNMKIRCCVAYGPQENDNVDKKEAFWSYLDNEVMEATNDGAGFVLHCDGNLWAGSKIVPGDPRTQNKNGKLFEEFLQRNQNLNVVNSLPQCEGLITRSRLKDGKVEESILDFFIICSRLLPYLSKMVIDNDKRYILTNYRGMKSKRKAIDSDHFTEYMDLNLEVQKEKPVRREVFNFKNSNSQENFKLLTSETNKFTGCFKGDLPILEKVEKWRDVLKSFCGQAFQKIRIKKNNKKTVDKKISCLINKRNKLHRTNGNIREIKEIEDTISELEALENREKILKNFQYFSENPEQIQMQKMWKTLKNLCPKIKPTLPSAKRNHKGKIISGQKEVKNLLAKEYKNRLRERPVRKDFVKTKIRGNIIFNLKMKLSKLSRSKEWTMKDLEKALGDLKNNKSRDYEGYINEIFKKDVIGTNLKDSLLLMFNQLKKENLIPKFLNFANITTVHKKGSKLELKNQRGIFRVPVTRFIMMRLIYNSNYPEIDKNISDCQMGARKGKGCKTNIWIVNGIIHDTLNNKNMKPVRLQITDYMQMFDSISLIEAINDIYDAGMKDDNLSLIYEANREIHMSVNTPGGLTERQTLKNLVLQGDTWGSILASVQVDSIGKNIEKAGLGYLYKGKLSVSLLGLVDDMIGISEAGYKSHQLNAIMNVRTAEKRLQFGVTKCKSMLVGKNQEQVINNALVVDGWEETYVDNHETGGTDLVDNYIGEVPISETQEQKYLGFVLSSSGNNMVNITALRNKSIGIIRTIMNKLELLHLKQYYFECALILMNTILRGSILYASETYYNLTENQLRNIERIEEGYLRKVLKTSKGCPIVQLYLSMGQWPARFEIQKYRLLFLKTILEQEEDSMVSKFFKLQMEHPTKGDWVLRVMKGLSEIGFSESLEGLKTMSRFKFNKSIETKLKKMY